MLAPTSSMRRSSMIPPQADLADGVTRLTITGSRPVLSRKTLRLRTPSPMRSEGTTLPGARIPTLSATALLALRTLSGTTSLGKVRTL